MVIWPEVGSPASLFQLKSQLEIKCLLVSCSFACLFLARLLAFMLVCLLSCLFAFMLVCFHACLLSCLFAFMLACFHACSPASLPAFLLAYFLGCLPFCQLSRLLAFLLNCFIAFLVTFFLASFISCLLAPLIAYLNCVIASYTTSVSFGGEGTFASPLKYTSCPPLPGNYSKWNHEYRYWEVRLCKIGNLEAGTLYRELSLSGSDLGIQLGLEWLNPVNMSVNSNILVALTEIVRCHCSGWLWVTFPCSQVDFFGQDSPVKDQENGVLIVRFPNGRASGDAFALFETEEDIECALKKDRGDMQGRYIELFRSSLKEFLLVRTTNWG